MKTKVSGVWKDTVPSVKVSGVWKFCTKGSVRVSGVWRDFYAQERVSATYIFSANSLNPAPNITGVFGYIPGKTDLTIIVNPGVYIWSNSATPAMQIIGGTVGDTVTLINNGFIMGRGGNAGYYNGSVNVNPTVGQPAISTTVPMTIDTLNGYIGGGGGGGGSYSTGGGGAGGGLGGWYSGTTVAAAGGAVGAAGANGNGDPATWPGTGGGSGGRIMPGVGGAKVTVSSNTGARGLGGGSGGSGSITYLCGFSAGGGGGGWGAKGGDDLQGFNPPGGAFTISAGKGGTANAEGDPNSYTGAAGPGAQSFPGAAGGKAIVTNGHAITYVGASASRVYGIVG